MDTPVIPVHHWHPAVTAPVHIERIRPVARAVHNGVHRHDFHELFFFAEGTGEHMIDLEPVALRPPCVHGVAPGQVHQLSRSAGSSGAVVMFSGAVWAEHGRSPEVAALFQGGTDRSSFPIATEQLAEADVLIGLLERELACGPERVDGALMGLLGVLLLKTAHWGQRALPTERDNAGRDDAVQRFIRAVEARFLEHRPVSAYAADLALSPGRLNELVRKRLDKSAGEVVQDRLVLEAKRLLLHADLSVKEVSFALHMQDPAYFNRFFKKAVGMTPVAYREHIRGKYQH